jgi:hypothetical protein
MPFSQMSRCRPLVSSGQAHPGQSIRRSHGSSAGSPACRQPAPGSAPTPSPHCEPRPSQQRDGDNPPGRTPHPRLGPAPPRGVPAHPARANHQRWVSCHLSSGRPSSTRSPAAPRSRRRPDRRIWQSRPITPSNTATSLSPAGPRFAGSEGPVEWSCVARGFDRRPSRRGTVGEAVQMRPTPGVLRAQRGGRRC